jgi:hypothetical protein
MRQLPFFAKDAFIKDRQDGILYGRLSVNRGFEGFWGLAIDLGFANR